MSNDRHEILRQSFNDFWTSIFGKPDDYYSYMDNSDFDTLKTVLANINGIITYNSTLVMVDFIAEVFSLPAEERDQILNRAKNTNPYANGFDIIHTGTVNVVAEVKCNRPINNGNRFGGAQVKGINKDLLQLFNGKNRLDAKDLQGYYKMMGVFRFDEKTEDAVRHYIKHLPEDLIDFVELYDSDTIIGMEKAYIVLLEGKY